MYVPWYLCLCCSKVVLTHFYLHFTHVRNDTRLSLTLLHRNLGGGIGIKLDCKFILVLGLQFDWTTNALRTRSDPMVLLYTTEIIPVALECNKFNSQFDSQV